MALFSIDVPNSLRSVPASALAGSVAPISVRHFLIASGASSASTTAGPDDMNVVRLREERPLAVDRVEAFGLRAATGARSRMARIWNPASSMR